MKPVVVGLSGGSGAVLARAAIDTLLERGVPTVVTISNPARQVWEEEMEEPLQLALERWQQHQGFTCYPVDDFKAPIASGSYPTAGMLVIPCSTSTAAAIARGLSTNLLQRAAEVHLKEHRPLVLVPREAPLSPVHLENLLILARLGVIVLPPEPVFYLKPHTVAEVVQFIVHKALSYLGLGDLPSGLQYGRKQT